MTKSPDLQFIHKFTQEKARHVDMQNYEQYLDQRVIIEEVELGNPISQATLVANGSKTVLLKDYMRFGRTIEQIQNSDAYMPGTKALIDVFLPTKVMQKDQIASIQSLTDVLRGKKYEEVFSYETKSGEQ